VSGRIISLHGALSLYFFDIYVDNATPESNYPDKCQELYSLLLYTVWEQYTPSELHSLKRIVFSSHICETVTG